MSTIGHNRAPLADRIFNDPDVTVEDVLDAITVHLERQEKDALGAIAATASNLVSNKERVPDILNDEEIGQALDLLARLSVHGETVAEKKESILNSAKAFVANLEVLCKPLEAGVSDLEKTLRARLSDALTARLDQHNADRTEDEPKLTALTLRGSSGAKATLSDSVETVVESAADVPRKFCIPDAKLIAAAVKAGEEVPGTGKKRKTSLRIST